MYRRYIALAFTLLLLLSVGVPTTYSQEQVQQPIILLVRDGEGNPMKGVRLRLITPGPPAEQFDTCATDEAGQCRLQLLAPGNYAAQFIQGWRGQEFIPVDQQNPAVHSHDAPMAGFGFYLEPINEVPVMTFVIGTQNDQLVPLWDTSRSADVPPQPELMTVGGNTEGLELPPLASEPAEPTPSIVPTQQEDVEEVTELDFGPGAEPTSVVVEQVPVPTPVEDTARTPIGLIIFGGIIVIGAIGYSTFYMVRLLQQRQKQE